MLAFFFAYLFLTVALNVRAHPEQATAARVEGTPFRELAPTHWQTSFHDDDDDAIATRSAATPNFSRTEVYAAEKCLISHGIRTKNHFSLSTTQHHWWLRGNMDCFDHSRTHNTTFCTMGDTHQRTHNIASCSVKGGKKNNWTLVCD